MELTSGGAARQPERPAARVLQPQGQDRWRMPLSAIISDLFPYQQRSTGLAIRINAPQTTWRARNIAMDGSMPPI